MFIARVSKGRTVREFITCVLIVPTVVSIIWMSVFGESALHLIVEQAGSLANAISTNAAGETVFASALAEQINNEYAVAMFSMFNGGFPFAKLLSIMGVILVITFFVTSSDSGSLVIDSITAGGKIDAPIPQRVFWCLLEGIIAIVLLMSGGLGALQAASVATGLPFAIILILMTVSLYMGLINESKFLRASKNN